MPASALMKYVLLVEDDKNLAESLSRYLTAEGYRVVVASRLAEARAAAADRERPAFHVIVLDWMLPDGQGIDFLRELRFAGEQAPVILLTARTDLVDKILGLETGANDYVTKPFEPRELVARIRVQLRLAATTAAPGAATVIHGGITLNSETREVTYRGRPVELTKMEYELLKLFMENPNKVFSREEVLNKVWGYDSFPTTRTVDTHILQLRQKLDDSLFETIRGIGYRLKMTKNLRTNDKLDARA